MELNDLICNALKSGRRHYLSDITYKVNLLGAKKHYINSDVYKVLRNELKNKVIYEENTNTYYIKSKNSLPKPNSEEGYIIYALALSKNELTAIDIANYIKENYRKKINQLEIETQIFTKLKDRVGYTNSKPVRYYLKEN